MNQLNRLAQCLTGIKGHPGRFFQHQAFSRTGLSGLCAFVFFIYANSNVFAAPPEWWSQGDTRVIDETSVADNYAPVNAGQLKLVAKKAMLHLNENLQGGAGSAIEAIVAQFEPRAGQNYSPEELAALREANYATINLGQLKAVAKPFYDRLIAAGYDTKQNLIDHGYPANWAHNYPWDPSTPAEENYAAANIGQLKVVFSFEVDSGGQPPVAPVHFAAVPGNGQVTLSWDPVADATSYIVKRSNTNGSGYTDFPGNTTTDITLLDTGLANGTIYYYVVQAVNSAGTSPLSAQVAARPAVNQAPNVYAGSNQTVAVTALVSLNGYAYDDGNPFPPSTISVEWTKVSGPGDVSFSNASSAGSKAAFSTVGTYVIRITANDGVLSAVDEATITVVSNSPPYVYAGWDTTLAETVVTNLSAYVTDDGAPNPPGALSHHWTVVSGPGTATIGDPSMPNSDVSFAGPGTYVLRLTSSDGEFSVSDDVVFTIEPNAAPIVDVPSSDSVAVTASLEVYGSASDDGAPNPPGELTYLWSQISGPGTAEFTDTSWVQTAVRFDQVGTYVISLSADDGMYVTSDEMTVEVLPNAAPVVDNIEIVTLQPEVGVVVQLRSFISDDGAPDPPGGVESAWTKQSGPGTVTFQDIQQGGFGEQYASVIFGQAGEYVIRLTGFDGELSGYREVTINVIDRNQVAISLVEALVGEGITYSNVQLTGEIPAVGFFEDGITKGLGLEEGIVLTSGSASIWERPNHFDDSSKAWNYPGDSDLDERIQGAATYDALVLEFDFVASSNRIETHYVFGSEEYLEWVGEFNDAMAIFIDGINISIVQQGAGIQTTGVHSINDSVNSHLYVDNEVLFPNQLYDVEYDGFTTPLVADATIVANTTRHAKIVIADVNDAFLDSAVFLLKDSFRAIEPVGEAPTLTLSAGTQINTVVGSTVTFTVTGSDPDEGAVVTLSSTPLPTNATMDPALPTAGPSPVSSVFNWIPDAAGTSFITFAATDETGLTTLREVKIEVAATP